MKASLTFKGFKEALEQMEDEWADEGYDLGNAYDLAQDVMAQAGLLPIAGHESTIEPTQVFMLNDCFIAVASGGHSQMSPDGNDFTGSASEWREW